MTKLQRSINETLARATEAADTLYRRHSEELRDDAAWTEINKQVQRLQQYTKDVYNSVAYFHRRTRRVDLNTTVQNIDTFNSYRLVVN